MLMKIKCLLPASVLAFTAIAFVPLPGSAQVLLSAAEFALLGGTAITVGGPGPNPIVNGNVGLSTSATSNITGFPPAVVSGNTVSGAPAGIISTGGVTSQAGLDLITARNALFAMPQVPANNLSNLDLGTLAPLGAGVYFSSSATNQTGALVLDANFQNGVAWVFNFSLSLTTSANSTVTFINLGTNGGSDNGVYWNAATAINVGDNNTIVGNYLAGTSISFTGISTTAGGGGTRALAGAAVSFAGPGTLNVTGGAGNGDFDGGLMYNGLGQLVPISGGGGGGGVPPLPGVFTGNVLLSSTGAYVAGSSGVILVPGTNYPTTTLILDGNASNGSAPASLTINTATVTLTGVNTYTGGTVVNTGALIASTASLPANQTVALNSSSLTFNEPATGSFGGVISGTGSVNKQGAGALTLTAASTYSGGTNVSAGTLVASTAVLPANRNVSVTGSGVLVLNQTGDGTLSGNLTGGGKLKKQGSAALTIANITTSAIDVEAGSLFFNRIGSTVVSTGALLGSNGTVAGNLTNNGTLSPGFSPGIIVVTGNYAQSATGTLVIELASPVSYDQLVIGGTASLGGTLQVNTLNGFNPSGNSFTFLTAAGGVTGTFSAISGTIANSAATAAALIYSPNSVTLTFLQLPFAGFAQTPNQVAVANATQSNPTLTTGLNTVPTAGLFPAALNAHSPQGYEIWSDIAFAHKTALFNRLARDDHAIVGHNEYYFDASQRRGRAKGDRDVGPSTFTSTAGLVGGDHALDANLSVGGFFEHGKTISDLGSAGSRSTVKSDTLGVRIERNHGSTFTHGVFAYGFDDYKSTRPVSFGATTAVATSSTKGRQWLAGISGGQHFTAGAFTASPFLGVIASAWRADGFTESDAGAYNASVGGQKARSLRSQLGLNAHFDWQLGSLQLSPRLGAAWLHEFSNDARAINAAFGPASYAISTRQPQRDSAQLSAGVDLLLSPGALVYADVTTESGGNVKILSEWRVGLAVRF